MKAIHVGLVADPASPSSIARRMSDLGPPGREDRDAWDLEVVSEPFTVGSEDVDTALARLRDQARRHEWDLVIGLTELPLRDDDNRRYLLAQTDPQRRTAVLSLPALGGLRLHAPVKRWARSSEAWPSQPRRTSTACHSPASEAAGSCSLAWCSPTVRGSSCPGSNPRWWRHWQPEPSPQFGYWPAPCRGGA
ncbi:hypothetical protein GCM10009589_28260 [Arthrobacter pascens]